MMSCPKCKANALRVVEVTGHLETIECGACGHRTYSTASRLSDIPPELLQIVGLQVRWAEGHANASEIGALRALFPAYASVGVAELLRTVGQQPSVDVGPVYIERARHLQKEAESKGLALVITDAPAGKHPSER
jgi:hypothetical protein